jgi:hypothetical protein
MNHPPTDIEGKRATRPLHSASTSSPVSRRRRRSAQGYGVRDVAGLPVAVGLYTAFVPMVVYALLGTSRVLSVSFTPRWRS